METLLPWFLLKSVPGIGNHTFKLLMDHFKSPDSVFQASDDSLLKIQGITRRHLDAIRHAILPDDVKRDFDLVQQKGFRVITYMDGDYPPLLREIPDPPPLLYVYGHLEPSTQTIAIVGSRNATTYGISTTRQLAVHLASLNFIIVSGMAVGIDTAAHKGAIEGKGKTIAVLGSGLGRIYPPENRELFHLIAQNGAVISEFPMMMEPEAYNFPIRNRIISGISQGTVVVEATQNSGSLITARLAAEQNREVFAVPGSVRSFKSMGTHNLIKQGAKLVEHPQDILEELPHVFEIPTEMQNTNTPMNPVLSTLSVEEKRIFDVLDPYPVHVDDIVKKVSMTPGKVLGILLQLELKQMVQQSPGKRFSALDNPKQENVTGNVRQRSRSTRHEKIEEKK